MLKKNKYKRLRTCYKDVNIIYKKTNAFESLIFVGLETSNTIEAMPPVENNNDFKRTFPNKTVNSYISDCKNNTCKYLLSHIANILFDSNSDPIWNEWNELLELEDIEAIKNSPKDNIDGNLLVEAIEKYEESPDVKEIILNSNTTLDFVNPYIDENAVAMLFTKKNTSLHLAKLSQNIFQDKEFLTQLLRLYYIRPLILEEMADETSDISICNQILEFFKGKKNALVYMKNMGGFKISAKEVGFFHSYKGNSVFTPLGISDCIKLQPDGKKLYHNALKTYNLPINLRYIPYEYIDKIVYKEKIAWENPRHN